MAKSEAIQGETVVLRLAGRECELRILDSSDRCAEANVYLQEIVLHTQWIAVVRRRMFVDMPERAERLEAAGCRVLAALLQAGCTGDAAEALAHQIGLIFDDLLPAGSGELGPEVPNTVVFERLARVMEARRVALGKLLGELLIESADREKTALERILNTVRDERALTRLLDAVMGFAAAPEVVPRKTAPDSVAGAAQAGTTDEAKDAERQ
jgi:hypothetical protein